MQLSHTRSGKQGLETAQSQATLSVCPSPSLSLSHFLPVLSSSSAAGLGLPGLSAHSPCPFLHGTFPYQPPVALSCSRRSLTAATPAAATIGGCRNS